MARARAGLPRSRRLRRSNEFETVSRRGKRQRDPFFAVTTADTEHPEPRLGITVSRRVSPRAVVRNRIKRQIRESFRHHHQMLRALDIVVVAQTPAATAANAELAKALKVHWERLQK